MMANNDRYLCPNCGNPDTVTRWDIEQCDECGYPWGSDWTWEPGEHGARMMGAALKAAVYHMLGVEDNDRD